MVNNKPADSAEDAFFDELAGRLTADPMIGVKLGGKAVHERVLRALRSERGVHVESLLTGVGALAGYACQASVRAVAVARGLPETALLLTVEANGRRFFFGDALNAPLAESMQSVWAFGAWAVQEAGCTSLPDVNEIFAHVSRTIGSADFGKPRVPAGHAPQDSPLTFVVALWARMLPMVKKFCPDPQRWPMLFGVAVFSAITSAREELDPHLALTIVMEAAIPMSKIDLAAS